MDKVQRFLELLYETKISREYDRIVPVIGDEGKGKSTFMLECVVLWKRITGQADTIEDVNTDEVLDQIVYDRDGFKSALSAAPPQSVIPVMDAGRVLHKKEAMRGDQIELEKDLLDVRMREHLILLGFQSWDIVPTPLQTRRAKNAIVIPKRGILRGYSRDSMDHRVEHGQWPTADLTDSFPPLDGTDLWRRFKRRDRELKEQRIAPDDGDKGEDVNPVQACVEAIKDDGVDQVCGMHGGHNKMMIKTQLIEALYGDQFELSHRQAQSVKELLRKDESVTVPQEA